MCLKKKKRLCCSKLTFKCLLAVISFCNSNRKCGTCKFQENFEMHFNQNVFQGRPPTSSVYYRILCLAQLFVFQSSFIPKGIKWKEPPHMRGRAWATLATLHPLPSSRHSHSLLGTQRLLSQTTALGRGDTTYLCQRWANSPNWQSITFPWP